MGVNRMGERNLFPCQGSDGRSSREEQLSAGGRKSNAPGFLLQIPLPGGHGGEQQSPSTAQGLTPSTLGSSSAG